MTPLRNVSNMEPYHKELGADHVVNHRQPMVEQVRALGFQHVDHIAIFNDMRHWETAVELIRPQGGIVTIDDTDLPMPMGGMKMKAASPHWEFMFARAMHKTPDMIEQHKLLTYGCVSTNDITVNLPEWREAAWRGARAFADAIGALHCNIGNTDSYDELEKQCQRLARLNDAPLWSVGSYRGVISKIDLLFAIAGSITTQELQSYFDIAKMILGEDDPKLDLPEGERWAASIHGKSREFSTALREGISETLVLLAVHGNHLFRTSLGFNCEVAVTRLIGELLTPLKTRILEANDRDLAAYAEAAPDEFLSILEEDLRTDHPESYGLMRPAGTGVFGDGCARAGLLWALEGLAWNPDTLPRVALVLAQLAGIEIHDNWVNKPINSLESIFRVWMPQTAADHDTRLCVLKRLADKFPRVAWRICIEQLDTGFKTGHYSHKPRWRNDAHGFGEPFKTRDPIFAFMREMIDMALNWKGGHTREMLCDLIQHLHDLPEVHQAKVWTLVKSWADDGPLTGLLANSHSRPSSDGRRLG